MTISILVKAPVPALRFVPANAAIEIPLDASINEGHSFDSRIPQFPVEEGSNISDNIVNDPVALTITGLVTNTPITVFVQQVANSLNDVTSGDRVKTAFDALLELRDTKQPFTLVTGLKVYENMFFSNITFPRDSKTGTTSLRFTARIISVDFVQSRTVTIDSDQVLDDPPGLSDQSQSTKDTRKQPAETPSSSTEQSSSLLFDTLKGIGLL